MFDEIGRQKIDVIILGEIHYVIADNERRGNVERVTPLGYVFPEIGVSEFFVVRSRRLGDYFIIPDNFEPQFYHTVIVAHFRKKHNVLSVTILVLYWQSAR